MPVTAQFAALGRPEWHGHRARVAFQWVRAQLACALAPLAGRAQASCAPTNSRRRCTPRRGIRLLALTGMPLAFAASLLRAGVDSADDAPTELPLLDVAADPLHPDDLFPRPLVIARDARAGQTHATLKDSLGAVLGLILQDSFGGFEPPRLSIRGSGLQSAPSSRGVQFLVENFPLSLADGSFNSALIDPQLFERVKIFRGASVPPHAPAALGGAISLHSTPPTRGTAILPVGSARTEASSFGGARLRLDGRTAHGKAVLRAAGSFAHLDGFRDHSAQDRIVFFAKASRPVPVGSDPSVSVYHARAHYDVPGPLTLATALASPRSVSSEVRRDQPRRESEITQVTIQTLQQSSVFRLGAGLSWLHSDDWFRQLRPLGISDSQSDDVTFRGGLIRRFDGGAGEHSVSLDTTLSRGWRDLRRFINNSSTAGRRFGDARLISHTASIDLGGTLRLRESLTAAVGITGLTAQRNVSDHLLDGATSPARGRNHSTTLQPRAALVWRPQRATTFFAAVTRGAEPPTFEDLLTVSGTDPNLFSQYRSLATQQATTWEIGTSGSHTRISWDVTAYYAEWTNEILRLADEQGVPRGAVNSSPTRHSGIEGSLHYRILEGEHPLRFTATAIWNHFVFADDPVYRGNRLAGAPPHIGSAELHYQHARGFFAAATIEWTAGATPVDHANRLPYGGHALTHVRLGWRSKADSPQAVRHRGGWMLFLEVKNIFDRTHIASTAGVLDLARAPAATSVFLPGTGRSLTLGVEWSR